MRILDTSNYSVTAQRTLAMAAAVARARFHDRAMQPEHLAYALSEQEAATARVALVKLGVDLFRLRSLLSAAIETSVEHRTVTPAPAEPDAVYSDGGEPLPLAPLALAVLSAAQRHAGGPIHTGHLLLGLLTTPCMAGGLLGKLGVTEERLRAELTRAAAQPGAVEPVEQGIVDLVAQARNGALPPLLPRPRYTDAVARALLQQYSRGVVLVGEPGVGRWSVALALAQNAAGAGPALPLALVGLARDLLP
ncbi:MAG: Clp protease N-terminal domain-containing protein, partial [Dehalococcoidia bacterium]